VVHTFQTSVHACSKSVVILDLLVLVAEPLCSQTTVPPVYHLLYICSYVTVLLKECFVFQYSM